MGGTFPFLALCPPSSSFLRVFARPPDPPGIRPAPLPPVLPQDAPRSFCFALRDPSLCFPRTICDVPRRPRDFSGLPPGSLQRNPQGSPLPPLTDLDLESFSLLATSFPKLRLLSLLCWPGRFGCRCWGRFRIDAGPVRKAFPTLPTLVDHEEGPSRGRRCGPPRGRPRSAAPVVYHGCRACQTPFQILPIFKSFKFPS